MLLKVLICHRKNVWLFCSVNHIHGLCCLTPKPHCVVYVKCEGEKKLPKYIIIFYSSWQTSSAWFHWPARRTLQHGASVCCFASAITQIEEETATHIQEPLSSIIERARWHLSSLGFVIIAC